MAIVRAKDLAEALALAEGAKRRGEYDWFRGQVRDWRPLRTSLARLDEPGQANARDRLGRFFNWLKSVPDLETIAGDPDAFFAVAQHYGIPTNYLDFSTEPRVAAFFAGHRAPPRTRDDDWSCIICLNTRDLAEFWSAVSAHKPTLPEPRRVTIDIPELWRLQAQRGVFLLLSIANFDDRLYAFDRILFKGDADPATLIPESDIYPTQQSDLEIQIDQFFMLERMAEGEAAIDHDAFTTTRVGPPQGGFEAACFRDDLPVHDSWDAQALTSWRTPASELWSALSEAPRIAIEIPMADGTPAGAITVLTQTVGRLLADRRDLRRGPVVWMGLTDQAGKTMQLYWDGVRRWPYPDSGIARGLATVAVFSEMIADRPGITSFPDKYEPMVDACIGRAIEVEIAMSDGSYTRGYAARTSLMAAVRPDLSGFLADEWRPQISEIQHVLQLISNQRRGFVFDALVPVFVEEIVPTQVVLRGARSGKARLYNLARATAIALP